MLEDKPQIPPNYESPAQKVKREWEEAEIAKEPAQQRAFVRWKILGVIFYTLGFLFVFHSELYPYFLPPPQYSELKTIEGLNKIIKPYRSSRRISITSIENVKKSNFRFHQGCNVLLKYEFDDIYVKLKIDKFNYIYECHVEGKLLTSYQQSINERSKNIFNKYYLLIFLFLFYLLLCIHAIKSKQ